MSLQTAVDRTGLETFLEKAVGDFASAISAALVVIGDKLGLYKAMASAPPITSAELAERTGTKERYVREWLINQAAGGYVEYNPETGRYSLPAEHAEALTDDNSPFFVCGGFQLVTAMMKAEARIAEAFCTGEGMFWGEHHQDVFDGTERFFRPGYAANLLSHWIPSLNDVGEKLKVGIRVADIGCGHGASMIIMADAYPHSRFFGYDNHAPSIVHARRAAYAAGVANNTMFEIAGATSFPNSGYDFITFFDCLHDLGDPIGSLKRARESLNIGGTAMVVEPMAGETVESNFNPIGRIFSGASVLCCTPNAIASGQTALGTIATEEQLHRVAEEAGFTRFRRTAETRLNRVFELRP